MSRSLSRLLLPAGCLVLGCYAYSLSADPPQPENLKADALSGEIILIEAKGRSPIAIEDPRIRTIAGLAFVGGAVFFDESTSASEEFFGGHVWIPVSEISRVVEFETKAKFAARMEVPKLLRQKWELEGKLRNLAAS